MDSQLHAVEPPHALTASGGRASSVERDPAEAHQRAQVLGLVLLGVLIPLGYVWYTRHVWEDYFITFRHSWNLVEGKGLVYNPPERVHGFTSPLGTLLPALFDALTGHQSYRPALWLFRAVSIFAYVGGGLLVLFRIHRSTSLPLVGYAFVALYLLDVKGVGFSVNGMETGFMLLFVGWCLYLWGSSQRWTWLVRGLAWAGLLWTRPDGCVYIAALMISEFVVGPLGKYSGQRPPALPGEGGRRGLLGSLAASTVITAALYLPWVIFAWSYYGSPVPQTVRAKAPVTVHRETDPGRATATDYRPGHLVEMIPSRLPLRASSVFGPIYYPGFWRNPDWMHGFCGLLGIAALLYCLIPNGDRLGRGVSLCFVLLCTYLSVVSLQFPWYYPPVALLGWVVLAQALGTAARKLKGCAVLALLAIMIGEAGIFGLTLRQVKIQQAEIETGLREQVGLWLHQHVKSNETVFLEPLGYIGFFSQAHIMDWPGLVSPAVSAIRHQGLGYDAVIERLNPSWTVFRPNEVRTVFEADPSFGEKYMPLKLFDRTERLREIEELSGPVPGRSYLFYDAVFFVFKRRLQAGEKPPPELQVDAARCERYLRSEVLGVAGSPQPSQSGDRQPP